MPVRRRRRLVLAIMVVLTVLLLWCSHRAPIVLGTFNIRTFPGEQTDSEAVAAAIVGLGADAFAVQEIVDSAAADREWSARGISELSFRTASGPGGSAEG